MALPLKPGDVIDGRYVVERLLGQGGMGAVFVAHEEQLARRVAIKVLLGEGVTGAEAVLRFEREARAAAALESEHVTRIFSVGRLASGLPFMAMELLDGEDLAHALARRGPLPPLEVASVVAQACDALSEAHARGIVHRDLKPANLFLARRANGTVTLKVLDFGISKANEPASTNNALTATSALMGTPMYMSPEQLREVKNVDGHADVWALGVTMFELLTGVLPFNASGLAELCVKVLTEPPPLLMAFRRDVPPPLAHAIDRCLQKESGRRPGAAELGAALRDLLRVHDAGSEPRLSGASAFAPLPMSGPQQHHPASAPMPVFAATPNPPVTPAALPSQPYPPHPPGTVDPVARQATLTVPTHGSRAGTLAIAGVVGLVLVGAAGVVGVRALSSRGPTSEAIDAAPAPKIEVAPPTVASANVGVGGASASSAPPTPLPPPPNGGAPRDRSKRPPPATSASAASSAAAPPPSAHPKPPTSSAPATMPGGPLAIPLERR